MTEAERHEILAKLPTIHFGKCLKWWHDHWAHFIPFQGDYVEEDNVDQKANVVMEKYILPGNYLIVPHTILAKAVTGFQEVSIISNLVM